MELALDWVTGVSATVLVCDEQGTIVYMNDEAERYLEKDGGRRLLGSSVFDCHPGASRDKTMRLFAEQKANSYTICKNGQKKAIHQLPWYRDGRFAGIVELSVEVPQVLPHFDRK
jgi:transcriptional regulator with PAS, ATPase and Fis domain